MWQAFSTRIPSFQTCACVRMHLKKWSEIFTAREGLRERERKRGQTGKERRDLSIHLCFEHDVFFFRLNSDKYAFAHK